MEAPETPDDGPRPVLTAIEREEQTEHRLFGTPLPTLAQRMADRQQAYLDLLAEGYNYCEAAEAIGVNRSTAFRWRREYPEFAQRCRDAFKPSIDRLVAHIEKRALHSDKVAMWLLERRDPATFHIAQKLEHSGAVDLASAVLAGRKRAGAEEPGADLC